MSEHIRSPLVMRALSAGLVVVLAFAAQAASPSQVVGATDLKTVTLDGVELRASANGHAMIHEQAYYRFTNGIWAGYWVRESSSVYEN